MRVALIYNQPKPSLQGDHWLSRTSTEAPPLPPDFRDASEYGVVDQVELISQALREGGYEVVPFAAEDPLGLAQFLSRERPDFIFNSCETLGGEPLLEIGVAGMYELFGIPYTGTPALALATCLDKGVAKSIFLAHGVPTPRFAVLRDASRCYEADVLDYPLIVKPVRQDSSNGIDANAVVYRREALRDRVAFVLREFGPGALVEEFIEGRELNVAVLAGPAGKFVPLPISEILFQDYPAGRPHIVGYEAKWVPESLEYVATRPCCPASLPHELAARVRETALLAARVTGLADYGRVDMRVRNGDIFVLEINPNPDISADAGFVRAALASGRTHAGVVREILQRAIERSARTHAARGGV